MRFNLFVLSFVSSDKKAKGYQIEARSEETFFSRKCFYVISTARTFYFVEGRHEHEV